LTNYRKVHCEDRELSVLTAALSDGGWARATGVDLFSCQRSEARQNGKVEMSRERWKEPAAKTAGVTG
jgi:hypothetical protein